MNKNKLWRKTNWTYSDWLLKYKGKTVYDIDINEHTKWSKEFKKWKKGNLIGFLLVHKSLYYYKTVMTYDDWLKKYKGKGVYDVNLEEHTKWSKEFKKWKKGNIE